MKTMKKIILLILVTLIMVGCDYVPTDHITSDGKRVVLIDSCEYVEWSNGNGPNYTHKGNCRFCAVYFDVGLFRPLIKRWKIDKSALTREEAIKYLRPWLLDIAGNKIYVTVE